MTAAHPPHSRRAQRGAALLLAMFIIGLAVTALVVRSYDAAEMKARQEEKTMKALAEAKEALIAWSVAHPEFPGAMPYPDRGSGGSYDGESDCFNAANEFKRYFLIGMLPILDSRDTNCLNSLRKGISINSLPSSLNMRGKYGDRLWYAVSRNLVHNYEFSKDAAKNEKENIPPIINLGLAMANEIFANESLYNPPYLRRKSKQDDAIGSTPYRWLKVVDSRGVVISDRVAAVIIAPGLPLAGQDRSADAPLPAAYLDALGGFSNADYQVDDETFVQASESSNFNDRLVYITIDELLSALEKRVAGEVRQAINFPKVNNLHRPWMLPLLDAENYKLPYYRLDASGNYQYKRTGYVPARCISLEFCQGFMTRLAWSFNGVVSKVYKHPDNVMERLIVDKYQSSDQVANIEFFCKRDVYIDKVNYILSCSGEVTPSYPKRKLYIKIPSSALNTVSLLDASQNSYSTETIQAQGVGEIKVVTLDESKIEEKELGTISPANNAQFTVSNINLYPILPSWYFTNRWYEYLYAVVAPAYLPGGNGTCTIDACLRLHYVRNGIAGQHDNLPALIFTRRPPSTYQLNSEDGSEDALDFLQPLTNNTGLVTW